MSTLTLHMDQEEPTFGFSLPEQATFDEWKESGVQFMLAGRMINWLIGDWMRQGADRFGWEAVNFANSIFRRDIERFGPIVDVCTKFPEEQRHKSLTFGHHAAVVSLDDPHPLLERAEAEGMTVATLRAHVTVVRHAEQPPLWNDDTEEDKAYREGVQCLNRLPRDVRQMIVEAFVEVDCGVVEL
ncbi:hypothetical protein [Companilactobacillus sp.]|uniref:hypothetical protein n=1 Tax=Companilactobacillus sp. TaxID=2767905 RepID=UPI002601C99F|nr:hypothetical protein [Companilactobacillus sp.]